MSLSEISAKLQSLAEFSFQDYDVSDELQLLALGSLGKNVRPFEQHLKLIVLFLV